MQNVYFDLNGNIVEKTPETHPYSYDPFVIYKSPDFDNSYITCADSDRMLLWSPDKFQTAYKEIWGTDSQSFNGKKPEDINRFLNLYFEKDVKLEAVVQNCNLSTGFPYWTFFTRKEPAELPKEQTSEHNSHHFCCQCTKQRQRLKKRRIIK